jgi:2-C-methyl-D-erythritol 2,4-cyclodiphosphate synthase
MKIRTGLGYDVHKLVEGRELWLGGIRLDYELGLLGHSDADVLIHAICDALLGAANMRDIGYHFPDTAAETLNVDSKILLRKTVDLQVNLISVKTNIDISRLTSLLFTLEMKGVIKTFAGGMYHLLK